MRRLQSFIDHQIDRFLLSTPAGATFLAVGVGVLALVVIFLTLARL